MADTWFDRRTYRGDQWDLAELIDGKSTHDQTVSLVIPARDEAATIGPIVSGIHDAFVGSLVDELVVIDGDSTDDTARIANDAGATVHTLSAIRPDTGHRLGKGEAIWKSLFVTTGDLLVFMDADLTEWDTSFVTGLLGPMLTEPTVNLVKGFYERPFRDESGEVRHGGGRVTELVARPLLALAFGDLTEVVQPLAGEWAVRRSVYELLSVPVGYGVDLAALIDVAELHGLDSVAQVDLGRRAHSHQSVQQLGAMAVQLIAAVGARSGAGLEDSVDFRQFVPTADGYEAVSRRVELVERPPASEVDR